MRGFRNRYKTPGLGAPVAASLARGPAVANIPGAKRLGPGIKVPVTVLLDDGKAAGPTEMDL